MSKGRILVVDDESSVCAVLKAVLIAKGYVAAEASSGALAISQFGAFHPDLVLLDIRMPGMDGLETLRRLRDLNDKLLVIMLTGVDDRSTAQKAIELGACDYLTKPVSLEQLEVTLAVHLITED